MATSMKDLAEHAKDRANEHHKYKRGGWSWKTGIECHAFVGMVYKECGYTGIYNRIRKEGFYKKALDDAYLGKWLCKKRLSGLKVSELKVGDILYTGKLNHHTAIYIGNGMVAEAGGKCTKVARLNKRASKFKYCFRIPEPKKVVPAKPAKKKKRKSIKTIAKEVIAGKWGNGKTRIKRLKKAGYNYRVVQNIVNKLSRKK